MKNKLIFITILLLFLTNCEQNISQNNNLYETGNTQKETSKINNIEVTTWVEGLNIPWSIVFLDNSRALVTQRSGEILLIKDGVVQKDIYYKALVKHIGEGGLMGIEKDPDFSKNKYIYIMYTYADGLLQIKNKVSRLTDNGDKAIDEKVLLDNIPASLFHNGGRIKFGPDNKLYITTGDSTNPELAQDLNSLAGKILRINPDGSIPKDNPFKNSYIYSYGHRNPQGLAFDPKTKDLFMSTHGPSGEFGLKGMDRIDYIIPGENYGWPEVAGYSDKYPNPIVFWQNPGAPPSGMSFWHSYLFVASLKAETLFKINLSKADGNWKAMEITSLLKGEYGRLRDVVVGPDENLYILTSNRDGRGTVRKGDDRILKIYYLPIK